MFYFNYYLLRFVLIFIYDINKYIFTSLIKQHYLKNDKVIKNNTLKDI